MRAFIARSAVMFVLVLFAQAAVTDAKDDVLRAARTEQISSPGPQTLKFMGEGTFRYLGMKLYTARFYLGSQVHGSGQVMMDVPKRLVIRYLRNIPKKALIQAAEKNIRNNPDSKFELLKERLDQLHEHYTDLKKGDVYELAYSNGKTLLYYNGDLRAQIDGADFASAYFGIWVSERSISHKLRESLLGLTRSGALVDN